MSSTASSSSVSSADSPDSRQAAIKNRIITHMNNDHASSLQMYLQHFCGIPKHLAATARLTEVTNEHMIITSGAGRSLIPFDPPMKSLMETRERTVAMHHQALAGLGLSNTKIDSFAPPNKVWQATLCLAAICCMVTFPFRSQIHPDSNSLISKIWSVGGLAPGLATLTYTLSPVVLPFIIIVHAIETENFIRTRLKKYQVPTGSKVWWLWVGYVFAGGIACFTRFDTLVRQKEESIRKNEKH